MTPDERALRVAYLAEMWPTCRELTRRERKTQSEETRARDELITARTDCPPVTDVA